MIHLPLYFIMITLIILILIYLLNYKKKKQNNKVNYLQFLFNKSKPTKKLILIFWRNLNLGSQTVLYLALLNIKNKKKN